MSAIESGSGTRSVLMFRFLVSKRFLTTYTRCIFLIPSFGLCGGGCRDKTMKNNVFGNPFILLSEDTRGREISCKVIDTGVDQ